MNKNDLIRGERVYEDTAHWCSLHLFLVGRFMVVPCCVAASARICAAPLRSYPRCPGAGWRPLLQPEGLRRPLRGSGCSGCSFRILVAARRSRVMPCRGHQLMQKVLRSRHQLMQKVLRDSMYAKLRSVCVCACVLIWLVQHLLDCGRACTEIHRGALSDNSQWLAVCQSDLGGKVDRKGAGQILFTCDV